MAGNDPVADAVAGHDRSHLPVLLNEAVEALRIQPGGRYLDATFGRGGHSAAILERLGPQGRLVALDRDPQAADTARSRFGDDPRVSFFRSNFAGLGRLAGEPAFADGFDGILFDLGVSSPQLDTPGRGFSFRLEGPLDMRMDPDAGQSAAEWLAGIGEADLIRVLKRFGEERFARRIARAVVQARTAGPLDTTTRLAEVIVGAVPTREPGKHPATRSFQAIRIAVNDELGALDQALPAAVDLLAPAGRLAVISFHSLEDRAVKQFLQRQAKGRELPPDLPVRADAADAMAGARLTLIDRIRPGDDEIAANPRARSAVLRVGERLGQRR